MTEKRQVKDYAVDIRKVNIFTGDYDGMEWRRMPPAQRIAILQEAGKYLGFLAGDVMDDAFRAKIFLADDEREALAKELPRYGYTDQDVWMMQHGVTRAACGFGTGKGDGDLDLWNSFKLRMLLDMYGRGTSVTWMGDTPPRQMPAGESAGSPWLGHRPAVDRPA